MKKILHLSDLHFGTERPGIVLHLVEKIKQLQPDLIIVSGDLTQRARSDQFSAAKEFLSTISHHNLLCVPGNHDISLHNPLERFLYPFHKYEQYIAPICHSTYSDESVAIFGLNSVTPFKPMGGYVTDIQVEKVKEFFAKFPSDIFKIVVMHHNLIHSERHKIINDAERLINVFSACHVNIILSGHIHYPCVELLRRDYLSHNMYVITAGTAVSTRTAAPNSFNIIDLDIKKFSFTVHQLTSEHFIASEPQYFSE